MRAARAPRYTGAVGRIARSGCALVASLTVLVLLAYAAGRTPDAGRDGFLDAVLAAATGAVTGPALAVALVAVAWWSLRRLRLEWLAWRPGPISIPVFAAEGHGTDADPAQLTAVFRRRLATLRIPAPAPTPGVASERRALPVVSDAAPAALARAISAKHAYEIRGTLVERQLHPRFGVTVEVVLAAGEAPPPDTVYDVSWERAIERAADRAKARILPRTRRCEAVLAGWRGFALPAELLEAYEAALSLEAERRFDEALAMLVAALEHDPANSWLRLHVGHVQERLGLYLDALATYDGMLAVAERPDGAPRVWRQRRGERARRRALLLARHRRVVLLGGPSLGEQWRRTSRPAERTERDEERAELRTRLRDAMAERLRPAVGPGDTLKDLLAEPRRASGKPDAELDRLRRVLVRHALAEVDDLETAVGRYRARRREAPLGLTRTSVRLTRVCLHERRRWIEHQLWEHRRQWIWGISDVTRLQRAVREACGGRAMLRWHEHYAAACVFAVPLLVQDQSRLDVRDALARSAVGHLQQALACADGSELLIRRDWLLSEDPDLDGLRSHRFFAAFEAACFPAAAAAPRRVPRVQRLQVARYTSELLAATAGRRHAAWHARRATEALEDPHTLIGWWEDEAAVWRQVGRAAWSHRRWRVRHDLLETIDELGVRHGGAPLDVAFPPAEELARDRLDDLEDRLRSLARAVSTDPVAGDFRIAGLAEWIDVLRDHAAEGWPANADDVRALCDRQAAVWDRLRCWVAADGPGAALEAAGHFDEERLRLSEQLRALTEVGAFRPAAPTKS